MFHPLVMNYTFEFTEYKPPRFERDVLPENCENNLELGGAY